MIRDWEILSREQVEDFGIFQIHKKRVRSPRTGEISEALSAQFSDWVLVLALTSQNEVVMVNQYRHGVEQVCLELPGGLIDPNDDAPEVSASRELLEETGYKAGRLTCIGECFPQPAILSNKCYFYLAEDAVSVQAQELDAGEDIENVKIPLKSIPARIASREINHGMVLLAFFFYEMHRSKGG